MLTLDILIPAFNAEHCLPGTLDAIFRQTVPANLKLGVIVINNNSTDRTPQLIDEYIGKGVRRVDHITKQGRASTRNAGAAASGANYLLLLDADCRLRGQNSLQLVATEMELNIGAGFGYVTGAEDDFWGKYQRRLESERKTVGWRGWATPCCLINRKLFNAVGGFPAEYDHYGFEDRDLICQLLAFADAGILKSLPDLRAIHDDDTNARDVFEKMYESGRYSSGIFKRNHPDAYLATNYARIDVDTASTATTVLLYLLQPLRSLLARTTTWMTQHNGTPMFIGRPAVKLCSALSYFRGTLDRDRKQ